MRTRNRRGLRENYYRVNRPYRSRRLFESEEKEEINVEEILRKLVKKHGGIMQYGALFNNGEREFMVAFDEDKEKWIALDDNNEYIGEVEIDEIDDFIQNMLDGEISLD